MIDMKEILGDALEDSLLISVVTFKKTLSYAGFEMKTKEYAYPKIALLNIELELRKT